VVGAGENGPRRVPSSPGPRPAALPRKPSINDVARVVGRSYQTVSRVLNGAADVSPETRERVLAAIQEMGYRRNRNATALVRNRSTLIGIITDESPRYGPVGTLLALEAAARKAGYGCTVVSVAEPYNLSVQAAVNSLEDVGVDGVIVIAPRLSLGIAVRKADFRVPVEMIAAGASSTPHMFTYAENQELGARMATQHLIELGHTDIAHVAGSMEWYDGRVRKRGWKAALGDAGLPVGLCIEGDWSPGWAYQIGLRLIEEGLPTAIFAASDHTALGLMRAFLENGVRIPDDVSIVGFDDLEGSDYFFPPLTTVRQDFAALARRSIDLLLGSIEGRSIDHTPTRPILLVRESTTGPRIAATNRRRRGRSSSE
jgi:DNA-binding LacI/PurR family transcriptional regulator